MPTTNKLALIKQLLQAARNNLDTAQQLVNDLAGPDTASSHEGQVKPPAGASIQRTDQGSVIIEGVFDGQNMVGPDGKIYSVPANYASKSKLVEGDLLKLTISANGSFIYKQIGPVERDRLVGVLIKDEQSEDFKVMSQGRIYKVLLASITYFKAELGDEVVILVPKGSSSTWSAVENVIKKGSGIDANEFVNKANQAAAEAANTVSVPAQVQEEKVETTEKADVPEEKSDPEPVQKLEL